MNCLGGMFLWHYPHDRSHWALPSRFGLSEARTFLGLLAQSATVAPTLLNFSLMGNGKWRLGIRAWETGKVREARLEFGVESKLKT